MTELDSRVGEEDAEGAEGEQTETEQEAEAPVAEPLAGSSSDKRSAFSRSPKPLRRRNAYEKQALLVSVAALLAAMMGSVFTGYQALYAEKTYESEGPVLTMQPTLVTQVGDGAGTTLPVDPDHPQSIQSHLLPDHHAHLLMRFLNTGREATTIVDVSFDIAAAPVGPVKASLPFTDGSELSWCSKTGFRSPQQPPLVDCAAALPYTLEPGTIYTVSIGLDGYLPGMSTYAPNGFNVTVDAVGVQDSQVSTRVPLSVTP